MGQSFAKEVEEALVETAKESDRQKKFVERQSSTLKHRLSSLKKEAHTMSRHRLNENSRLLYECNDLRMEIKDLERKMDAKNEAIESSRQIIASLQNQIERLRADRPRTESSKSARFQKVPHKETQDQTLSKTQKHATNPMPAPWVVHSSLPKTLGGLGQTEALNTDKDQQSVHSLHGNQIGIQPPSSKDESKKSHGILASNANGLIDYRQKSRPQSKSTPNISIQVTTIGPNEPNDELKSSPNYHLSESQPILESYYNDEEALKPCVVKIASSTTGKVDPQSKSKITLNIPQATHKAKSMRRFGSTQSNHVAEVQIEKLTHEVNSLAQLLDESQREKDMQRVEINRLRRHLMSAVALEGSAHSRSQLSPLNVPHEELNESFHLPSINSYPSTHGDKTNASNPNQQLYLDQNVTNADIYGRPSEQDMQEMRLGPLPEGHPQANQIYQSTSSSKGSKASLLAKQKSSHSHTSHQQVRIPFFFFVLISFKRLFIPLIQLFFSMISFFRILFNIIYLFATLSTKSSHGNHDPDALNANMEEDLPNELSLHSSNS